MCFWIFFVCRDAMLCVSLKYKSQSMTGFMFGRKKDAKHCVSTNHVKFRISL